MLLNTSPSPPLALPQAARGATFLAVDTEGRMVGGGGSDDIEA